MSGIGSFSQEAYEQLRAAYASELLRADDQENAGVTIGKDSMGVETAAINSMWLDKTGLWKYPDGKGEYQDVEQKQQDLLAVLRNDDGEVVIPSGIDDEAELDSMSDEELDALVDEVLEEIDEDEDDSDEFDNLTDEEFDQLIDQILTEIEEEDDETAIEEPSAEDISARIQELKAELRALTEGQEEEDEEEEETEDIDEPEETEGEEEETESDQPEDNDEEDLSNDEPD